MSEAFIGLTIIAFSTSLPELATTLVAAHQGRTGVAMGTVVGSNMLNILAVIGVAAVVSPIPIEVPATFLYLDFPVMLGTALLVTAFVWRARPIGRWAGALMVVGYAGYILTLFLAA